MLKSPNISHPYSKEYGGILGKIFGKSISGGGDSGNKGGVELEEGGVVVEMLGGWGEGVRNAVGMKLVGVVGKGVGKAVGMKLVGVVGEGVGKAVLENHLRAAYYCHMKKWQSV